MKKIKYAATFADGQIATRSSHRTYTHATRVVFIAYDRKLRTQISFAGSADLARKNIRSYTIWLKPEDLVSAESVPVTIL